MPLLSDSPLQFEMSDLLSGVSGVIQSSVVKFWVGNVLQVFEPPP